MNRGESHPALLLSVGMLALFIAGSLLLVIFAAGSYRGVVDNQYDAMDERALTAYISASGVSYPYTSASVKANDSLGAVDAEDSEYGRVLVVTDTSTGWALRYYLYDGWLVEDFAQSGTPLSPDLAQPIAPTGSFSAERTGSGLWTVTTDAGRTVLDIRSEREGTP